MRELSKGVSMESYEKNIEEYDEDEREVDEYLARRKNPLVTYFRGDNFDINLATLEECEEALKNLKAIKTRNCKLNVDTVSYRTLHHWDSINLIECERETSTSWRKFNVPELLWVHVILKFREMGVSLDKISQAKSFFFEKIPCYDMDFVDYYIIGALYFSIPAFFVTLPNGQSEFLAYHEMTRAMCRGWLNDCVIIQLNPLMNKIFHKIEIKSKFPAERPVTFEQHQICELMDREEFDSIKIVKSKGRITHAHIEKGFSPSTKYSDIIEGQTDATISTKLSRGKVTSRKRSIKVDIF